MKSKRKLRVVELKTRKVVRTIDVSGKSDNSVDRVLMGLLRNMDVENFYVEDSDDDDQEDS